MTEFGSSKFMEAVEFTGILSNRHRENPGMNLDWVVISTTFSMCPCTNSNYSWSDFHSWNIVVIRYCDGASFAGDAEGEDLVNFLNSELLLPILIHQTDGVSAFM
jgi:hypothetical protein